MLSRCGCDQVIVSDSYSWNLPSKSTLARYGHYTYFNIKRKTKKFNF